ncbi:putative nucleotidyltransferase with HDIG domain [Sphingomonas vulcanisoli]|uniref:Nucleotidyltransferase with HDIG domain n=1 Tax=Sphingomonas vulcanisoli TaxID=1658060 RepID=A0ABX0TRM4_9SPHN|nr:HD-GYP domain-containing protein [Sphingomonas vulcanisoli]NIJ06799.1 putative nucleotidyltransferase with HDIG domain [Sphingomonas vulcanisoli]
MKRRIELHQLRMGMYVVGFEGSWLKHPFWRKGFVVHDEELLRRIADSEVDAVLIDDERGLGPDPSQDRPIAELDAPQPIGAASPLPKRAPDETLRAMLTPKRTVRGVSAPGDAGEIARATETVRRSKQAVMAMFRDARLGRAIRPNDVAPLVEEIAASVERDASAMLKVTRLKNKNEYTYLHSVAVCALMINLGRELGLDDSSTHDIGMAGLLHDIGKMAVPDAILEKPGSLTSDEFDLIRNHPAAGHALLAEAEGAPPIALDVCLHHHERIDGKGYPFGLSGERLSLHARMGAVCDVYDAITSNRPYKAGWQPTDALSKMLDWDGHFDPAILQAFIHSIGIYPVGALVRLRTNRLGIVTGGNPADPLLPKVRAFYSTTERELVRFEELTCSLSLRGDNIVGVESGEAWFGTGWSVLRALVLDGRMPDPRLLVAASAGHPFENDAPQPSLWSA